MQHTFIQKLLLVVLAGAITAGVYVGIYKGIILGADQSINGGYKKAAPAHTPVPHRRF